MAHRTGGRRRTATAAKVVCEAIEARRYFTVVFGTPTTIPVSGARAPIEDFDVRIPTLIPALAVATSSTVQILVENDSDTFTLGSSIALPSNSVPGYSFLLGGFTDIGFTDIVLLSQSSVTLNGVSSEEGVIQYEAGNGDGTFTSGATSTITDGNLGFTPISGVADTFDKDDPEGLAVVGKPATAGQLVLAIMTSNNDGTFSETADLKIAGSISSGNVSDEQILTADLGNGQRDILVYDGSSGNLDVFMGDGTGQFTQLPPIALKATLIGIGQFANISGPELLAADGDQLNVLLSNGNGTFAAQPPITLDGTINSMTTVTFTSAVTSDFQIDLVTNFGVMASESDGSFEQPIALPGLGNGAVFANDLLTLDINQDYQPDLIGLSSAGNAIAFAINVTPINTVIGIESSDNAVGFGDDVSFIATVNSQTNDGPPILLDAAQTGTVEFFDGTTDLGSAPLVNGTATFDAGTGLAIGRHFITAQYSGDPSYDPSTSEPLTQAILAPTTITITSGENPSTLGEDITFTAIISGNDGAGDAPGGDVEFFNNDVEIGTGSVDENGVTTFATGLLSIGSHQITAEYQGDGNFSPSTTSSAVTQTINEPPIVPLVTSTTILTKIIGSTTVYGKAVVTLTNETASPITGPMDITLFASGDGVINSSTAMLATPPARDWKIKPGATVKFDVPINVPSLPLSAGSYTLLARISYGNGQITNAATGPTLQVIAPVIALTDVLTVRHLPSAFISGTKTPGVATVHITNDGNIPSEGPVTISLSASTEQNVIRTTIISVTKKLSIKLDGSANVTIPLKAIPALDDGDYFIVVQTTDPQGNTSVTSTATTVHATAPVVSLSASVGSIDPTPVAHGQPVHLSIAITNSGNVDATGPITFAVGVSIDGQTVVATLVDLIGSLTFIPGTTKTLALTFEIPADATAGSFFPTVSINQNGSTASAIGRTQFTIV